MKKELLKRKEVYSGTICDLVRTSVANQELASVEYVSDGYCVKVDDKTFFDYETKDFLPEITIQKDMSVYSSGRYFLSPVLVVKLETPLIFEKNENGDYHFCGSREVVRVRKGDNSGKR